MTGKMSVWEIILLAVMIVSLIVIVILGSGPVGDACETLGWVTEHFFVLLIPAAVTILAALAGGWRLSVLSFLGIVLGLCFGEWFALRIPEMGIHNGYAIFFVTTVIAVLIGIAAEILWHKFLAKK